MLKQVSIGLMMFFCLASCLANTSPAKQQENDKAFSAPELNTADIQPPTQADALFLPTHENDLWAKNALGEDFHQFFIKKIKNKKTKYNALKMDYHLSAAFKVTNKADQSHNSYIEIDNAHIETLDAPEIQFSDDAYQWNPANVSIMKLGQDYQLFVDDEVSTGQLYKGFWDGEETTAFEDFIDEYFSFHTAALIRYLILLVGIFFVIAAYLLREKIMAHMRLE